MLRRLFLFTVLVVVGSLRPAPAHEFVLLADGGFEDCQNTYTWSMTWFKDRLFVGTSRGSPITGGNDPELCPIEDDAAEIWRYSPETELWEMLFKSPRDVHLPAAPDGFVARDNGFRDMIVFEERNGTEALYVAGVVFPFPDDPRRPRILRSTDGERFEPVPQDPGTFLGDLDAEGFRAMAVFRNKLYVTAGSSLGEGVILESARPAAGNDSFRRVSPPGLSIFEMEVFDDLLYVGSGESVDQGFSVLKTDARGAPPYDFVPVVSEGGYPSCPALRGLLTLCPNNTVLSMEVFGGSLYVGGQTDVLRVESDDSWHVVVGNPRETPEGPKEPLSGRSSGFGNFFTGHVWRLQAHDGKLYAGTWDFSTLLRNVPVIGRLAWRQAGFDLWVSDDGIDWERITREGLGNPFNHGVRGLESTPAGLFLGTINPWEGTEIWVLPQR